jgi:hypothetical protein
MNIGFFLDELVHFLIALTIGIFFYRRNRDWRTILLALIFGFFLDLDHFFDYFAYFGWHFNFAEFLNVDTYMDPSGKIYVLLHGWEFLLPLWLFSRWLAKRWQVNQLEWAVTLAYFFHLAWDNHGIFTGASNPLTYFFTYRLLNNFSVESYIHLVKFL